MNHIKYYYLVRLKLKDKITYVILLFAGLKLNLQMN